MIFGRSERGKPPVEPVTLKILVAGGFGVGKTTLVGAVSEIRPLRTEELLTEAGRPVDDLSGVETKNTTTVAMDFGRITLREDLVLYLFGTPGLREEFLGAQRPDLADRADERGLAHAEAAGHQDLERDGLDRGFAALRTPEDHRSLLLLDGGRAAGRIPRRRGFR